MTMTTYRLLALILLLATIAAVPTPARASEDAVSFGSNIRVAPNAAVHDAVCFFCNVYDEGEVKGDIVVFFGNVHIAQKADRDVVNFFGRVSADDNATVGQDMVNFFGGIRLGENVSVGKDMVAMFGSVRAPASVTVGADRVVQPPWLLFGPLVVIALIVIVIVREFRAHQRRQWMKYYSYPPRP
jgi:hypothetical protein